MKYFLVGLYIIMVQSPLIAQTGGYMEMSIATDYTTTPSVARYKWNGHGDQILLRYGIGVGFSATNRIKVGIDVERYSRKECYSCVYFPTLNNPPQSAYHPLINNSSYGCEFATHTRINFIEIPLFVSYDFFKRDDFSVFFELGYGYQILTNRKTILRDLQSDIEFEENEKSFIAMSKQTARLSLGLSKNISPKITFNGSLIYKIDSFQFHYQAIGLNTVLQYDL